MRNATGLSLLAGLVVLGSCPAQGKVSFQRQILPILQRSCMKCHKAPYKTASGRTKKPKARLRLDGSGWIMKGSQDGVIAVSGKPQESSLYRRVILDPDDDDVMPGSGDPLTKRETELIRRWIADGCDFGGWVGKPGPGGDAVRKAQEAARPKVLSTASIAAVAALAKGMKPALPQAVQRAAGRKCQVVPAVPNSPLLRVAFVSNESSVKDADMSRLSPLATHITHLSLAKTKITDDAMSVVGRMKNLTRLNLSRTSITDDGLHELTGLGELRYLNLHSTAVTDRGVQAFGQLAKLEAVYLWNTKVTEDGVQKLRELLPGAKISYRLDIPAVEPRAGASSRRRRR